MLQTRRVSFEARLYQEIDHDDQWVAWSANIGWVRFQAHPNGWAEREPVAEVSTLHLREVPLPQAFQSGLIKAFQH